MLQLSAPAECDAAPLYYSKCHSYLLSFYKFILQAIYKFAQLSADAKDNADNEDGVAFL